MNIQIIEFIQAYGIVLVIILAFIMALSVSGYWVAKTGSSEKSILGVIFSVIACIGVIVMFKNLKIGLGIAVVGYLAKSIFLVVKGYGLGSFLRPLLYFKAQKVNLIENEEDVLDLF